MIPTSSNSENSENSKPIENNVGASLALLMANKKQISENKINDVSMTFEKEQNKKEDEQELDPLLLL